VTPLLVVLGAGVGAPLRYLAGHWLDGRFPWGTLLVNLVGSFLLGLFTAMSLGEHALAFLGTGFCGGFTTYSAFAVKAHERGWAGGTAYVVATVPVALAACALGFLLG
jgi:CrcB protein